MIGHRVPDARTAERIFADIPLPMPRITTAAGVYRPSTDSALLCSRMVAELLDVSSPIGTVIELCAGSGIASVYAASAGARVTAIDDTAAAERAVRANASANGVMVDVVRADVRNLPPLPAADLVVANPPYVPAPPTAPPGHAWNAGPDGRDVLDAMIAVLPRLVRPGGRAIIVQSDVCGVEPTLAAFAAHGFAASVTDDVPVDFGPVMTERADWLERRGLIEPGRRTERLVVVRANRTRRNPSEAGR
ncbi:methyltransferase [Gordonia neofelifaecis]|uniref:Putative methyltransferase n=1 Tax=Gordonia neofelifaecis NRRL B-59395 TaxID=644548 RepID=F1YGV3_9ACTN|nr:methyltransferase [Gordonia neofelifaecis]EGD56251.1 putative methyltransferase [Gordonia neofelifaecis NRRL B-59395]